MLSIFMIERKCDMRDDNSQQQFEQDEEMQQRYAQYITDRPDSSRPIGNGDILIKAMEDGYLWDDFCNYEGINNECA